MSEEEAPGATDAMEQEDAPEPQEPATDEPVEAEAQPAEETAAADEPSPPPPEPESGQADLGQELLEAPVDEPAPAEQPAQEPEPAAQEEEVSQAAEEPAAEQPPVPEVPSSEAPEQPPEPAAEPEPEPAAEPEPEPEPAQQEPEPEPEPQVIAPAPKPVSKPAPPAPPPEPRPSPPAEQPAPVKHAQPKPKGVESLGEAEAPFTYTRPRDDKPWLDGTFKTPKGRIITGEQLCQSLSRMTNAYVDKYMAIHDEGGPPLSSTAGSLFNTKRLPPDELETVINRLYSTGTRDESSGEAFKVEHVQLKFDDNGKEQWVPVKTVSQDEQKEYMCSLYERCIEQKKRTEEDLAAKYLQPLGKPRKVA